MARKNHGTQDLTGQLVDLVRHHHDLLLDPNGAVVSLAPNPALIRDTLGAANRDMFDLVSRHLGLDPHSADSEAEFARWQSAFDTWRRVREQPLWRRAIGRLTGTRTRDPLDYLEGSLK